MVIIYLINLEINSKNVKYNKVIDIYQIKFYD